MVRRVLLLLLLTVSLSMASESGRYAYRAQQQLQDGRFALAYDSYTQALLASRKESDLLSEARVLLSMAQIRINSLDLDLADSLLSIIREPVLDAVTRVALIEAKMELFNAHKKPEKVLEIGGSILKEDFKGANVALKAAVYAEKAYAFAQIGRIDSASKNLDAVKSTLSKKDGRYILAQARVADISKKWEVADSLYTIAEKISIAENRIYRTATILYFRSKVFEQLGKKDIAEDAKKRSAQAFDLMGLPKLKERSEK